MNEAHNLEHEQIAADLGLYATGSLEAHACPRLREHLDQCPACRLELEELRAGAAMLALEAYGPTPPARSRARLLDALQTPTEPDHGFGLVSVRRRPLWTLAPVFTSLVLAVCALLIWREDAQLKRENEKLQNQAAQQHEIMDLVNAPDSQHVTLVVNGAHASPQVRTIYQKRTGRLLIFASNLGQLPPDKTYELWLLPMRGAPVPAVRFKPNRHGSAVAIPPHPVATAGTEARGFAITVEPDAGSNAPTTPVVMESSDENAGG